MTWEYEQIIEMAEQAEIAAQVELEQFGCIVPGYERKLSEYDPDETVCLYEYGVEWDGFGGAWGDGIVFDEYAPYSLMV